MLLLGQKLLLEKLEVRCKVLVNGLMNTCQPKKPQQDRYKQQLFAQFTVRIIYNVVKEPELNKAMVLLLARCWEYKLKTEDVLELTQVNILMSRRKYFFSDQFISPSQGNRKIALCTVVGLLEDGETYSTELKQRQKPGQGKMGQWEHELVCHRCADST